jgi:hypothetical protein
MDWKLWVAAAGLAAMVGLGLWWLLGGEGRETVPYELLGSFEIATEAWTYGDMVVGGISGLAFDPVADVYYAISDSRGDQGRPGKLFTLEIEIDAGGIEAVDVRDVLLLDRSVGEPGVQPYGPGEIDAEEVLLGPDGTFLVASERDLNERPWIRRFSADGEWIAGLELPPPCEIGPERGVRSNLGFEAMTLAEDASVLYVANEQALAQDGPLATPQRGSFVRIVRFELQGQTPSAVAQYVYETEPIFTSPEVGGFADNGVSAMLDAAAIDPVYDLIVMERGYVAGVGNHVALFGVSIQDATNVNDRDALGPRSTFVPVRKTRLLTLSADPRRSTIEVIPDNMEAMTLGPRLRDGRRVLLLGSDNNFNPAQRNLFVAFAVAAP